jgi:hypothetical protein
MQESFKIVAIKTIGAYQWQMTIKRQIVRHPPACQAIKHLR